MSIDFIENEESGLSVRNKLNQAITKSNSYDEHESDKKIHFLQSEIKINISQIEDLPEYYLKKNNLNLIDKKDDFPEPNNGVIFLNSNEAYYITSEVDLEGIRISTTGQCAIIGSGSDISSLKSTGLSSEEALITSTHPLTLKDIELSSEFVLNLESSDPDHSLIWSGVNIVDSHNIGYIKNYRNIILSRGSVLNSANLVFDGDIESIAISEYYIECSHGETFITLPETLIIGRRLRVVYSVAISPEGSTIVDVSPNVFPNPESAILESVYFEGVGNYITGLSVTSEKRLIINCQGIRNTAYSGQIRMLQNSTETIINQRDTYYKVAGTTSLNLNTERFVMEENNQLKYIGGFNRIFHIMCNIVTSSSNNQTLSFKIRKDGEFVDDSEIRVITTGSGDRMNITLQTLIDLKEYDTIELWCANNTSTSNITVHSMNMMTI